MSDFRSLVVWQTAHSITLEVYRLTSAFPAHERYGLASQMRRAAVSVAANIAESRGRIFPADRARFLHIALGSAHELEYHLCLAHDLEYIAPDSARRQGRAIREVQWMLAAWIRRGEGKGMRDKG